MTLMQWRCPHCGEVLHPDGTLDVVGRHVAACTKRMRDAAAELPESRAFSFQPARVAFSALRRLEECGLHTMQGPFNIEQVAREAGIPAGNAANGLRWLYTEGVIDRKRKLDYHDRYLRTPRLVYWSLPT